MAKALDQIGEIYCPVCLLAGRQRVIPLKQQGNGLAICNCPWCTSKIQTFSGAAGKGDSILRGKNLDEPEPAPVPASKPQAAPVQAPQKPMPQRGGTLLG